MRSIVSNQVAWGKALLARGLVTSPALALCALELGKKGRVDHKRVDLVKQLSDGMRGGTTKYVIAALLESMRGDSQVEMLFVKELAAMARKAGIKRTGLPATALVMSRADSSSSVLARQGGSTCDGHTDSVSCPGRYAVLLDPTYADRAKARLAQRLVQQDRQTLLDDENNFVEEDWC